MWAAVSRPLAISVRRGASIAAAVLGLAVCGLLAQAPSPAAAAPTTGPLTPFIVGGQEAAISQFPWQVYVLSEFEENGQLMGGACGGSILDSMHILTAAHCVDVEGTTTKRPTADFLVVSGDSNVNAKSPIAQAVGVASIRTHPYYTLLPESKDDVAVITLSQPLALSEANDAEAIPLVPTGATPAPGTSLSLSGYGKEEGAEGVQPNGKLYSTTLTALSSDACRSQVGVNSSVLLCALGTSSSACNGDSGGPLTEGTPAVEVGLVDFGPKDCPIGHSDAFVNVAAPEVRAFIEGSETPPVAPRPTALPAIRVIGSAPVDYSPLTCEPGVWNGSPSLTYTFQSENASPQVLQSGPSNVFAPPASLLGVPVVCIVQASNSGGVSTLRSGTTPPITADTTPPVAAISAVRCHLHTCTLSIAASDPYSVALGVQPWVSYTATGRCAAKRRAKSKKAPKSRICSRTATVHLPVASALGGSYQATATGLPYNQSLTFIAVVTNAAGLRPTRLLVRPLTLHPPARKARKVGRRAKPRRPKH
jgi:hypothetical protein